MNALAVALALAAPPPPEPPVRVADVHRLPPRHVCSYHRDIAACCMRSLRERLAVDRRPQAWAAFEEAQLLFLIWDAADDARLAEEDDELRLMRLRRLRHLMGPEAYFRMDLPPPVPLWRFAGLD